jgi:MoaA/NifB/PqqE/SkfB family radical SAM enzyme
MRKLATNALKNVARSTLSQPGIYDPVIAALYVTPMCNLRCDYCELFGTQRNAAYRGRVLDLPRLKRIVDLLANEIRVLYLTGGEPTLRDDIGEILRYARERGVRYLAMNTNGLLLHRRPEVMDHLDTLTISLDSLEHGRRDSTLAHRPAQVRRLLDNVRWVASQQQPRGFTCVVTCVVMPGMVDDARRVMEFCFEVGAEFSIQHLTEERVRSPALKRDPEFRIFVDEMIAAKRAGKPISGSQLYLETVRDQIPFRCTPTAVPHIDHLGRLSFPCRELRNHLLVDLLSAGSLRAALAEGVRRYGLPPVDCSSCPDRCYVEISSLTHHPSWMVREVFGYLSRQVSAQWSRRREAHAVTDAPAQVTELRKEVGPATDAHGPATDAHGPATDAHGPATDAHGPATDAHGPATDAHGPATDAYEAVPELDSCAVK